MDKIVDFFTQIGSIVFWFIIILIPLVAIHEFGHLLFARLFKVKVIEYGIGIPPRTKFYKKWKGIIWSLNWLPLGGFAKIYGDHDAIDDANENMSRDPKKAREEYKKDRMAEIIAGKELQFFLEEAGLDYDENWKEFEKAYNGKKAKFDQESEEFRNKLEQATTLIEWELDSKLKSKEVFFNKKYWQKAFIMLGGVIFNLITAWFIFVLLIGFSTVTRDVYEEGGSLDENAKVVSEEARFVWIVEGSPADRMGLEPGDYLLEFNGVNYKDIETFDGFSNLIQETEGRAVEVKFRDESDNDEEKTINIAAEKDEEGEKYKLGVGISYLVEYESDGFWSTFGLAKDETKYVFKKTWSVLGQVGKAMLPGAEDREVLKQISGPIGVGYFGPMIFESGGFVYLLYIIGAISVGLAVFNLLPIPALDGGRLVILTINRIIGKRSKKVEAVIISATMIILIGFMVWVAINDIKMVSGN